MSFYDKLFRLAKKRASAQSAAPALGSEQVARIKESFGQVRPIADQAADIFYGRLFEIAPEVKPLFGGDLGSEAMTAQGQKLMATLGVVVNGLHDIGAIAPVAADLAKRHVDYGVKAEHYASVGEALIFTLEKGLGEAFTPELRADWATAYTTLSAAMIAAAYPDQNMEAV